MATRTERNRRYQEKLKAEREELMQLREEKKRWEEERKMIYTTLQTGVNDLIDKYNDTLKYVFDEEDEIDRGMIESLSVAFIQLPDIEITNLILIIPFLIHSELCQPVGWNGMVFRHGLTHFIILILSFCCLV